MRSLSNKYEKQLLNIAGKTWLDALKTASKKVVHKASEAIGEFVGDKILNKIMKPKFLFGENPRNIEKMVIPPDKKVEMLSELREVL